MAAGGAGTSDDKLTGSGALIGESPETLEKAVVILSPLAEVGQPIDARIPVELAALAANRAPWISYVAFGPEGTTVGACAFKSPPNAGRQVEVAYLTFAEFEGRGIGTAMVQRLIEIAADSGEVAAVIARTLREENASVRICRRLNFDFDGDVIDPDDGLVWQWTKKVSPASH